MPDLSYYVANQRMERGVSSTGTVLPGRKPLHRSVGTCVFFFEKGEEGMRRRRQVYKKVSYFPQTCSLSDILCIQVTPELARYPEPAQNTAYHGCHNNHLCLPASSCIYFSSRCTGSQSTAQSTAGATARRPSRRCPCSPYSSTSYPTSPKPSFHR